ncbi:MAG: hypothetical protein ACTH31_13585 [Pseudoclavibacter sp.]
MTAVLRLPDDHSRDDLTTFLSRAARIEGGAVRIQGATGGSGSAVAVWVPVLRPQSILDDSPIVLGMRAIAASVEGESHVDLRDGHFDAALPIRGMLDRLASEREQHRLEISLPPERLLESWAAVSPPRGDWQRVSEIARDDLVAAAERGIDAVAQAVPGNLGTLLVERARTEVWASPLDVPGASGHGLVAGAAFAAHALGFLVEAPATLNRSGVWLRLSTPVGHVLTKAHRSAV